MFPTSTAYCNIYTLPTKTLYLTFCTLPTSTPYLTFYTPPSSTVCPEATKNATIYTYVTINNDAYIILLSKCISKLCFSLPQFFPSSLKKVHRSPVSSSPLQNLLDKKNQLPFLKIGKAEVVTLQFFLLYTDHFFSY